jgi:hypothetical protein
MEGSPLDYIDKIRPVAQPYGICKIVPPEGWKQTDFFGEFYQVGPVVCYYCRVVDGAKSWDDASLAVI